MTRLAIAINLDRCVGCHTCALSCKMQNNVPMGMAWNRVLNEECEFEVGVQGTYPHVSRAHLPVACQHCENPACLRVCPTGATYKDDKGRVEIDYDKCIGCRMCMAACPYQVRNRNEKTGAVDKCRFCNVSNYTSGTEMCSCVTACPTGARIFGDLDDPLSDIAKKVADVGGEALFADLGLNPSVLYVGLSQVEGLPATSAIHRGGNVVKPYEG